MRHSLSLLLALTACAEAPPSSPPPGDEAWADALAWTYLYEEVDEARSLEIREDMRQLDPEAQRALADALVRVSGMSAAEEAVFRRAAAVAGDRSFLDLSAEEGEEVLRWATDKGLFSPDDPEAGAQVDDELGLCWPGYVSCPYTTAWNKAIPEGTCAANCRTAFTYDRVGNSSCEAGRCDYRLKFAATSPILVDGRTSMADCIVNRHRNMSAFQFGPEYWVLLGGGTSLLCGSVFPMSSNFQVQLP